MRKEILRAEKINKSFPGVKALSDVSFNLLEGEVHILLGENGAGKSTLMKIFSGLYSIDSGDIFIDGQKVTIRNTKDSQDLGIAIIYQEFNLVPHLTVAQNIYLGREPLLKSGNIDKAKMRRDAQERLDFLKAHISADTEVATLGVAQQQMVEIAKALSQNARILIMDEPTAALSEQEIEMLFCTIKDLTAHGVSIIYISHRLQELKVIGDRITILETSNGWGRTDKGWVSLNYVYQDGTTGTNTAKGIVTGTTLNVRSGPGINYNSVANYSNLTRVNILEQIKVGGTTWGCTKDGWISLDYVYIDGTTGEGAGTGTVSGSNVNIRSGPGTGYNIVGSYNRGDTVEIYAQFTFGNTKWGCTNKGWVSMDYVEVG